MTGSWAAAQHDLLSRDRKKKKMRQFLSTESCYNKANQKTFGVNHVRFFSQTWQPEEEKSVLWGKMGSWSITRFDICCSPASCHVTPIWSQWSPGWGWASCGSRPWPGKPANSQNTSSPRSLFWHVNVSLRNISFLASLLFVLHFRHLPSVTQELHCFDQETHSFLLKETVGETLLFWGGSSLSTSFRTGPTCISESVSGCSGNWTDEKGVSVGEWRLWPVTTPLRTGDKSEGGWQRVHYLEGRGRVWVHLDQGGDQNHAGELSRSFAGG